MVWFYLTVFEKHHQHEKCLSIPLWSDFITVLQKTLEKSHKNFQSHYGLILSSYSGGRFEIGYTFNPTMVWFYHCMSETAICLSSSFQSHYGLILSGTTKGGLTSTSASFQSHYGLILSRRQLSSTHPRRRLSIPLWSDFIPKEANENIREFKPFNPTMVWFYHSGIERSLSW